MRTILNTIMVARMVHNRTESQKRLQSRFCPQNRDSGTAILSLPGIAAKAVFIIMPIIVFSDGVVKVGAISIAIPGPIIAADSYSESHRNRQL